MEGHPHKPPRATRHVLQVPLRFRPTGHGEWRDGLSENISQSGVLFRCDLQVTPQTEIEMLLTLGSGANLDGAATLLCRGRVVRIEPAREDDPRAAIAATIACRQAYLQGNDPRRI